jgi:hypothetical protein
MVSYVRGTKIEKENDSEAEGREASYIDHHGAYRAAVIQ